ncbi:hypothetical protein ASG17_13865 [Brevundimonas sp. Leaf363]|uniref:hypothetical protein n=1 Tax=Brevundimonas sp. Leaf363 TaxID=1736353 RepID=UPI0006F36326|nr:hypothetical protein [Brevundimonas sp. Leaf363]KQS54029.1 hypothetical protein ASG17_13865 [Brevundimonas sp. Leaf363]
MLELGVGLAEAGLRAAPDGWVLGFERGRWFSGRKAGDARGASVSRAGAGTAFRADGTLAIFAADAARITDRGLLVEEARTNLLLNSAAPAGQTVTLAAGTYALSAWGAAGQVAAAAGTAVGSGWGAAAATPTGGVRTLTITTSGTVVLTVAGGPERAQLELGTFPSRPIVTGSAAATRGVDLATAAVSVPAGQDFAVLYEIALERDAGAGRVIFDLTDGTAANKVRAVIQSSGALQHVVSLANVTTTLSATTRTASRTVKGAVARTGTSWLSVLDGVSVGSAALGVLPVLTGLAIGASVTGGAPLNDTVRQLIMRPGAADGAWLEAWTR